MPPIKDPVTGKFVSAAATIQTEPNVPPAQNPPADGGDDNKGGEGGGEGKQGRFTGAQALMESWLGDKPVELPEKPETKKADDPGNKKETKTEKPPAKPKAATPKPETKPLTAADIAAAAAEGVARALPKTPDTKKAEPDKQPDDTFLSASDKRKLPVLAKMEEKFPERYKGLSATYRANKKALVEYADTWKKDHPGEEFDETAPEHEDFFAKHDIDWEDEDYLDAAADLKVQAKLDETDKKTQAKLNEFERKEKLRDSQPKIIREQNRIGLEYWKASGDDFTDILNDQGVVNADKIKALMEADPGPTNIRLHFADQLDRDVAEISKLMGLPGENEPLIDFDPKNETHVSLAKFAIDQEDRILAMPAEDRRNQKGQMFMPAADYVKLSKEERPKYWTFSGADLCALRAVDLSFQAGQLIKQKEQEFELWAKARGVSLPSKSQKSTDGDDTQGGARTEPDDDKPSSPTAGGGSKMAASKSSASASPQTGASSFVSRSF